jgi:hypothetical protein
MIAMIIMQQQQPAGAGAAVRVFSACPSSAAPTLPALRFVPT